MNVREAYNKWSEQYDTNKNKTRDLEASALRSTLRKIKFKRGLELGCGTGKNTVWLVKRAIELTSVDFSEEMLARAKKKIRSVNVEFVQADITKPWKFAKKKYDLLTFSLVLEHIKDLNSVFKKAATVLKSGAYVYIGELHPFKQYSGTKARYDSGNGTQVVTCYDHHVSDFTIAALRNGFTIESVNEYFDSNKKEEMPRILVILLKKK